MSILLVYPMLILIILFFRAGLYGRKSGSVSAESAQDDVSFSVSSVQDDVSALASSVRDDMSAPASCVQDDMLASFSSVQDDMSAPASSVRDDMSAPASSVQDEVSAPASLAQKNMPASDTSTQPSKNENLTRQDYSPLDSAQGSMIKAAACLAVILHHLIQRISNYGTRDIGYINIFNYTGILFTAVFFFFSGYGLIMSLCKKPDYLRTFPWKRFPKVLLPFWLVNFLGVLLRKFYYGYKISSETAIKDILGTTLINSNGWFIIEILILYLAFYIIFTLIKNRKISLVVLCIFTLAMIYYAFGRGHDEAEKVSWFRGEWWFNSTIAFIVGLVIARIRLGKDFSKTGKIQADRESTSAKSDADGLDRLLSKHYLPKLIVSTLLFGVSLFFSVYAVKHYGYYHEYLPFSGRTHKLITLGAQSASCLFFIIFFVVMNYRIRLGNKVLVFIGSLSMELFLIHGYILELIFKKVKASDLVKFALVYLISIAIAFLVSRLTSFILKKYFKLFDRLYKKPGTHERMLADRAREEKLGKIRKVLAIVTIIAVLVFVFSYVGRFIFSGRIYSEEMEKLKNAKVGDEVYYGYYETDTKHFGKERVTWLVVKKEADKVCLISKEGLNGDSYNQKHTEVDWESSDIRRKLNSEDYTGMFSRHEIKSVLSINGDMITLLTMKEAEEFFESDKERQLAITEVAEQKGTNINVRSKADNWDMKGYRSSWWWLRREEKSVYAPIVSVNGEILPEKEVVNRANGAIRPVIWVSLNNS